MFQNILANKFEYIDIKYEIGKARLIISQNSDFNWLYSYLGFVFSCRSITRLNKANIVNLDLMKVGENLALFGLKVLKLWTSLLVLLLSFSRGFQMWIVKAELAACSSSRVKISNKVEEIS